MLAIEARATPYMAQRWIDVIRTFTDLPFGDLVLTHYHAVRVLGACRLPRPSDRRACQHRRLGRRARRARTGRARRVRMPRLFAGAETIPGLTRPTDTFDRPRSRSTWATASSSCATLGRGHTAGDIVVWLPEERICFGGDLVEAQAAPYMGDGHIGDWRSSTLDAVAALGATQLVGGRGPVVRGRSGGAGDRRHASLPLRRPRRHARCEGGRWNAGARPIGPRGQCSSRATAASRSSSTPCRSTCSALDELDGGSTTRGSGPSNGTGRSGRRSPADGRDRRRGAYGRPGRRGRRGPGRHDPGRTPRTARRWGHPHRAGRTRHTGEGQQGPLHAAQTWRSGHAWGSGNRWPSVVCSGTWAAPLPAARAVSRPAAELDRRPLPAAS